MIVYRHGIHIQPNEGQALGNSTPLTGGMRSMFLDYIQKMLDDVYALPLGKSLINEIGQSGKKVTIFKSNAVYEAQGPTTLKAVANIASDINKMVKSYRPLEGSMRRALANPTGGGFGKALPSVARVKGPGLVGAHRAAPPPAAPPALSGAQKETIASSELTRIFDRASVSFSRKQIATLIGVSEERLQALEEGADMSNDLYARIGMTLYEFLMPGSGIDTAIRFAPIMEVPDHISMGHELIHAWRMMKGLRLFSSGWEEEAMTTGFPPFANFKYTENKLRIQANMAVRNSYNNPVVNSLFMQNSYAQGCGMASNRGEN